MVHRPPLRIATHPMTHAVLFSSHFPPSHYAPISLFQLLLLRRFVWLVSSVLIGGEHRGHEKARLRKGVTIIVATPGRLQVRSGSVYTADLNPEDRQ